MHVSGGRVLGAAIAGALALQVWGAVWWMALSGIIQPVGNLPPEAESVVIDALLDHTVEEGAYFLPGMPVEETPEAMESWMTKQRQGPLGMVLFHPAGVTPLDPVYFVRGFVINVAACFLACVVMLPGVRSGWAFPHKLAGAVCFGVVASLVSYGNLWNWMHAPSDFAVKMSADVLGGWLLAGVAIAAILKGKHDPADARI